MRRNRDRDLNRVTEVARKTAIEKDVTRRQSQSQNRARDRSLRQDLDQDREANLV